MSVFGFKAFENDFTCLGFQYEIGKIYEIEGELKICKNGFHFCKKLKDCFRFYGYDTETKIAIVEALGEVIDSEHKSVTNKIKIVKEIPFSEIQNVIKSDKNKLFDIEDGMLKDCFKFVKGDVVIPDEVTSIEDRAFTYCSNMTSVTIHDGVTSIGDKAFAHCTNLTSINIPDNVTSIRGYAFYGCTNLTSITIPNSVISIENGAFDDCISLTSITIPDSVTNIGMFAFTACISMTDITILNPKCIIPDSFYAICNGATIHGYKGSTAEQYAKKFRRKFIPID